MIAIQKYSEWQRGSNYNIRFIYSRERKEKQPKGKYKPLKHSFNQLVCFISHTSNPPNFDKNLDTSPTISAYTINVGGSDTTKKLKVISLYRKLEKKVL